MNWRPNLLLLVLLISAMWPASTTLLKGKGGLSDTAIPKSEDQERLRTRREHRLHATAIHTLNLQRSGSKRGATEAGPGDEVHKEALADALPPPASGQIEVVVALVPNPELSHLALTFDRTIDSIQAAAEDSDYDYETYFFPWIEHTEFSELDPEKREASLAEQERRLQEPGALVFRKRDDKNSWLVVFLVGESPTSGVEQGPFKAALQYQQTLGTAKKYELRIVGPQYSGSFASLSDAIAKAVDPPPPPEAPRSTGKHRKSRQAPTANRKGKSGEPAQGETDAPKTRDKPASSVRIINPGATLSIIPKYFLELLDKSKVEYSTTQHSDFSALSALQKYITRNWPGKTKLAVLAEDDTAYAVGVGTFSTSQSGDKQPTLSPKIFTFPREISRLRNARVGENSSLSPDAAKNPFPTVPLLPFSLRDQSSREDSVPSFSPDQTPISQESALLRIAAELKQDHEKLVLVTATDPLDTIFLLRYLRVLCPDVQFVVFDADLLFAHGLDSLDFTGLLSVSIYPLTGSYFKASGQKNEIPFPSRQAQGEFQAMMQILKGGQRVCAPSEPMSLTVISRSGISLLATLPFETPTFGLYIDKSGDPKGADYEPPVLASVSWQFGFGGLFLASAIFGWYVIHAQKNVELFESVSPYKITDVGAPGNPRMVCASLILLTLETLMLTACPPLFSSAAITVAGMPVPSNWVDWVVALLFAAIFLRILPGAVPKIICAGLSIFLALEARLILAPILVPGDEAASIAKPFDARYLDLFSGVNLLIPVCILLFPVILFLGMILRWLHFWPEISIFKSPIQTNQNSLEIASRRLKAVLNPLQTSFYEIGAGAAVFLLHLLIFPPWEPQVFDNWVLGFLYFVLLGLVDALISIAAVRLVRVWLPLRSLLKRLEDHPIREAFSALPKDSAWAQLDLRRFRRLRWKYIARARECLDLLKAVESVPLRLKTIAGGTGPGGFSSRWASAAISIQRRAAAFAQSPPITNHWNVGRAEALDVFDSRKRYKDARMVARAEFEQNIPLHAAEEVIARVYLNFIRQATFCIGLLLQFIATAFVLVVISANWYPFRLHRELEWGSVIMLIVLGAAVIRVVASLDRDAIFSRLSETKIGSVSRDFFLRVGAAGLVPILAVLATQFPHFGRFLYSLVQPAMGAIK